MKEYLCFDYDDNPICVISAYNRDDARYWIMTSNLKDDFSYMVDITEITHYSAYDK